jgi:hypothetical protein
MMNTELRRAGTQDIPLIVEGLKWMLKHSPGPQMVTADIMEAELSVRNAIHNGFGWVIQGYFIMVSVGKTWYSGQKFLIEDIILRIEKTGIPVTAAVQALDDLADFYGCDNIAVGDTQVGYMTSFYQAHGYVTLGTQLFKEVRQHGLS